MVATAKPAVLPADRQLDSALMEKVRNVDLSQVRNYLISRKGWSIPRTDNAIEGYCRFLYLCGTFHKVRPPQDVDEVWHRHILHTEQYANDCMNLFGRFIHHRPFPIVLNSPSDCENDCESRAELKADCENDCESRTLDCENDCESRMTASALENECESDDDEDEVGGDEEGDLGGDEGDLEGDDEDEDYRKRMKSYSFTELTREVFGEEWRAVLN